MEQMKIRSVVASTLFVLMLMPIIAWGGTMDDVVKKAESELKKTDMDLKTGGHKKVADKLPEIDKLVAEVQAKAPDHERLPGLVEKLKTQKEKVEAKLGTKLSLKTDLTVKPKAAEPAAAAEAPKAAPKEKVNFSDPSYGKIKRGGSGEAQAEREAYRAEEKKQGDDAAKKSAAKEEMYQYYSKNLYQAVRLAKELPGNDLERHLEATEKVAAEMPTIKKMLEKYKELSDEPTYRDLKEVADNAAVWRMNAAKKLAEGVEGSMRGPRESKGANVSFNEQIKRITERLDLADKYVPNLPEVKKLRDEIALLTKSASSSVAAKKWEGHKGAPANVADLTAAAMKYFKGPKGWADKYTVLAVAIRGDWTVQKKNIVGAPILYGIAVHLALQKEEDKPLKQVRVFNGTLITVEKEGVKPEPPFDGFYVGDNWLVNADSVK
jgi:hypothetical protein